MRTSSRANLQFMLLLVFSVSSIAAFTTFLFDFFWSGRCSKSLLTLRLLLSVSPPWPVYSSVSSSFAASFTMTYETLILCGLVDPFCFLTEDFFLLLLLTLLDFAGSLPGDTISGVPICSYYIHQFGLPSTLAPG